MYGNYQRGLSGSAAWTSVDGGAIGRAALQGGIEGGIGFFGGPLTSRLLGKGLRAAVLSGGLESAMSGVLMQLGTNWYNGCSWDTGLWSAAAKGFGSGALGAGVGWSGQRALRTLQGLKRWWSAYNVEAQKLGFVPGRKSSAVSPLTEDELAAGKEAYRNAKNIFDELNAKGLLDTGEGKKREVLFTWDANGDPVKVVSGRTGSDQLRRDHGFLQIPNQLQAVRTTYSDSGGSKAFKYFDRDYFKFDKGHDAHAEILAGTTPLFGGNVWGIADYDMCRTCIGALKRLSNKKQVRQVIFSPREYVILEHGKDPFIDTWQP